MRCLRIAVLIMLCCVLTTMAQAADFAEVKTLKAEADETLRKASGMSAEPKLYAEAVRKLEKAMDLLDELAKADPKTAEPMQEEITSALFWARRFANVNVAEELNKPGSAKPPQPPKAAEPPPPPAANQADEAEKAFRKAEAFETERKGDDYAIALRWFQVADQFAGTDWSPRALQRAQDAQARFRASQKPADTLSPADKLVAEGDALMLQKKPAEALQKFLEAKKIADTTLAERRIGGAHLAIGYQGRDEYASQYLPLQKRFQDAQRRGARAEAEALRRQAASLVAQLRPLEDRILKSYQEAQNAYQKGLDLAKGKDLDCEAHLAILHFERKNRMAARPMLKAVLDKYAPANDEERTLIEYCKGLVRLMGG